jgi:hypothetical protein
MSPNGENYNGVDKHYDMSDELYSRMEESPNIWTRASAILL